MKKKQQQYRGFNQVALARVGIPLLCLLACGFLASSLLYEPKLKLGGNATTGPRAADVALLEELRRLRATWRPVDRASILAEAPRMTRFAAPLRRLLAQPSHGYLEEAIDYAAALGDASLREPLVDLTKSAPPKARARAVTVVDELGPWTPDELSALLAQTASPILIAAVAIASARADAPWPAIVALLDSEHTAVRDAVMEGIPSRATDALAELLWKRVGTHENEAQLRAVQAFARTGRVADFESQVYARLAVAGDAEQIALLDLLATKDGPLAAPEHIWAIARNASSSPEVRASAIHTLEKTASFDAERLTAQAFAMEPIERYFAARCLVAAGKPIGGTMLVELLDVGGPETVTASRRLLSWLTGLSPASTPDAFLTALSNRGIEDRGPLPDAGSSDLRRM